MSQFLTLRKVFLGFRSAEQTWKVPSTNLGTYHGFLACSAFKTLQEVWCLCEPYHTSKVPVELRPVGRRPALKTVPEQCIQRRSVKAPTLTKQVLEARQLQTVELSV